MQDTPVYRIAKWEETFEKADSRRHKTLNWIAVPIGFTSNGFAQLVEDFGDRSPSIYGAWIALAKIAGSCPIRGLLSTSSGAGLTAGRLSFLSHFPSAVFVELLDWASSQTVGWIEVVPREEVERLINDQQTVDDRLTNELQDKTRQDVTRRNDTGQDKTGQNGRSTVVVDFDSLDGLLFEELQDAVSKFRKLSRLTVSQLPTETAIRLAALDSWKFRGLAKHVARDISAGTVRKPDRYVNVVIEKKCTENGIDHAEFVDHCDSMIRKQMK